MAFRKKDWRAYCAAAGDADGDLLSRVTYEPERLLQGIASALRDACRLRRQLEETLGFGFAAANPKEEINVEEPTDAPMPVLNSPEFEALMEALCCSKGKAADSPWCLRWDRPQEILVATADHLELLTSRDLQVKRQYLSPPRSVSFCCLSSPLC